MIFKAKQFVSGYQYYTFEAKDEAEAKEFIKANNEGRDFNGITLREDCFLADDGDTVRLIK